MTSSVSGNFVDRACFRILILSCGVWSAKVHWRMSLSRVVVTQLVTHIEAQVSRRIIVAYHGAYSKMERSVCMPLAVWLLTAGLLIPIFFAISASDRSA